MQFQPRSEVLTGTELLELVAISPDELAMKAVRVTVLSPPRGLQSARDLVAAITMI